MECAACGLRWDQIEIDPPWHLLGVEPDDWFD